MITILNANTLGISEYDISNVIDIVSASGTLYYCTPSGVYYLDSSSTESVTSVVKTGKVFFADNSPKLFPYLEFSCDVEDTGITSISTINSTPVTGIDFARHTEEVRSHRLPAVKQPYVEITMYSVDDTPYKISDLKIAVRDTLVKK
jgi:hypothetical protein